MFGCKNHIKHHWEVIYDNGYTAYYKCRRCDKRDCEQPPGFGWQSIDYDWLAGKSDMLTVQIDTKHIDKCPVCGKERNE